MNKAARKTCIHYLVSGRVQGVFYRASAQDEAKRLGLTGWVRNRQDGDVELVACGDADALEQFEGWLWEGPPHAQVRDIVQTPAEETGFSDFLIRR
jgi:acylphosphatase